MSSNMILPRKVYDVLKPVATTVLPGLSAFYFALGAIWGLPYVEQIVGTIAATNVLLGTIIGLSSRAYNNSEERFDGSINIMDKDGGEIHQLAFSTDPEKFKSRKNLVLKVNKVDELPKENIQTVL